ncbi:MAG: SPOR domain-containing protein [Rhodobacteraceae bacterium]|jgi:hypothetical protein|nr:SPOR domain-containing protein [Paracoccaceae bacterium]
MAQFHYEAYHAPQTSGYPQPPAQSSAGVPRRVSRLVNLVGAVLSVALVTGVGVWSYRLMVRDVSGVPVIQALAGPYRVTPDDPGGLQASYQGLAVNSIAADGSAAGAAQVIALAPPPVELSAEDRAVAALIAGNTQPITAPAPATLSPGAATGGALGAGQGQALAAASPAPASVAPAEQLALVPASLPGVARSPLPRRRPGTGTQGYASAAPATASAAIPGGTDPQAEAVLQELVTRLGPTRAVDIDPDTLAPGTRLVQLGAYDSDADARAAWDSLVIRFPAYLEGRGRIIESASAGGRTFYRLRAHGFTDEPEARRFCSVFLAENADCIPVLIR